MIPGVLKVPNKLFMLLTALLLSAVTQLSSASIIDTVDFTITNNPGSQQDWGSNWAGMGFANVGDTITGSFNIAQGDTDASDVANFLLDINGSNYAATSVVGSINWTGSNVTMFSFSSVTGPDISYSYIYSNNTANITLNGVGQVICNWCMSINSTEPAVSSVPEPGVLALLGLGMLGFVVARRRKQ
jgi:hypothetical protein